MFFIKIVWLSATLVLAIIADHRRNKPLSPNRRKICLAASAVMLAFYIGTLI